MSERELVDAVECPKCAGTEKVTLLRDIVGDDGSTLRMIHCEECGYYELEPQEEEEEESA